MPAFSFWFTGGALAACLALLTTTATVGFAWYRAAVTEQEAAETKQLSSQQSERTRQVKALLGNASRATIPLFKETYSDDELKKQAEAWVQRTYDLISAAYGDGEAALFLDNSGYVFYGDASEKRKTLNWIDGRSRRLAELIPRTDRLQVQDTFDSTKFSDK
jgi:hypothetical protein